jgi:glycosyltransferase involved in cell wall biosynthesis
MNSTDATPPRRLLYVVNEDWAFLLNRLPMARAAQRAGYEIHVATRVNDGTRAIEAEGFTLHPIPLQRGGISPLSAVPAIIALRQITGRIKPDIAHHSGLQCCVFGSIAAFGRKFPYVSALTGMGYVFTSATWRTRLLRTILKWLLPSLLNRPSDAVLVQNPDDRAALVNLGISEARVVLIPGSGVDTEALQPLPEPDGPITYGFAGRLLTDKGIRALVAAHEIVRAQGLQTEGLQTNLLIAGNPDPANPASVSLQEVNEWTKRAGVTWLGHVKDISSLWKRCHFAILPSHREGLPGSLMEAAACGRAMIATDAPGCREIVIDNQTGLLVGIEDPPALARAIVKLATSPELRARYGKAARELVVSKLSAKIVGEQIVQLYDGLVAARRGQPPSA